MSMAHRKPSLAMGEELQLMKLHSLLLEAQRYHNRHPSSRRASSCNSSFGDSRTSISGAATPTMNTPRHQHTAVRAEDDLAASFADAACPWRKLHLHVDDYWRTSESSPDEKYRDCLDWLNKLLLWDVDTTWDQLDVSPRELSVSLKRRRVARLRKIEPGQLFEFTTVPK